MNRIKTKNHSNKISPPREELSSKSKPLPSSLKKRKAVTAPAQIPKKKKRIDQREESRPFDIPKRISLLTEEIRQNMSPLRRVHMLLHEPHTPRNFIKIGITLSIAKKFLAENHPELWQKIVEERKNSLTIAELKELITELYTHENKKIGQLIALTEGPLHPVATELQIESILERKIRLKSSLLKVSS